MLLAVTNSILSYLLLNTHFQMSTLTAAAAAAFQTAADLCAETDFVPRSKLLKTPEEGES